MAGKIIDGKRVAARVREEVAAEAEMLKREHQITPHLAAVLVGDDPASQVYVRNKERACEKAGLKSTLHRLPADTPPADLMKLVQQLNEDESVDGILVQLPLPGGLDSTLILDAIRPDKDVDGFHPENVGRMLQGRPRFLPCTPAGVMRLLEEYGVQTAGAHAVIVGRSDIVGKPMAALLMQRGADATVTVCHSRSRDLAEVVRSADIIIAAVGRAEFITGDMVRDGAVVIDVGINRTDEGLVGDVNFGDAANRAEAITPVPGGVGPMTIAMLLQNTLKAARLRRLSDAD